MGAKRQNTEYERELFMLNVRYLIDNSGNSLRIISSGTRIPKSTLQNWKHERGNPEALSVLRFAKYFNVKVSDLFTKQLCPMNGKAFGIKKIIRKIKSSATQLDLF